MHQAFEFDEPKSQANKRKHGIDFREAQDMFTDGSLLRIAARSDAEPRFLFVGMIGAAYLSAITTYRGDVIRLISVRRSRAQEVQAYERE